MAANMRAPNPRSTRKIARQPAWSRTCAPRTGASTGATPSSPPESRGTAEYLRQRCLAAGARHLRACYPNDIYKLVKAISEYEGRPVRLIKSNIDRAVDLYFARSENRG